MIPHATRGASFKGLSAYLLNNTAEQAPDEPNRVAWAETENLAGLEAEDAWRVMAMTAQNAEALKVAAGVPMTGAKSSGRPVYHFSLAWALDETPDDDHMRQTAREAVAVLGLHDHQWMMVRHTDKEHAHIHIMANLVHGETGKTASLKFDHGRLSAWAGRYEREHGIKCPLRLENEDRRKRGENTKYQSEKRDYAAQVTKAWERSDSGAAFVHALEDQRLSLANGTRNGKFVVVDDRGDIQALDRQLDLALKGRAKGAAIREKLAGLELPDGSQLARQIKDDLKHSREAQDSDAQGKMLAAADAQADKLAAVMAEQDKRAAAHAAHLEKVELRQMYEREALESHLGEAFYPRLDHLTEETERMSAIVEGRGVMKSLRRIWRGEKDKQILTDLQAQRSAITEKIQNGREDLAKIHAQEKERLQMVYEDKCTRFGSLPIEKKVEILRRLEDRRLTAPAKGKAGTLAPASSKAGRPAKPLETANRQRRERLERQIEQMRWRDHQAEQRKITEAKMMADRERADTRAAEIREQNARSQSGQDARRERLMREAETPRPSESTKGKGKDFEP